MIKGNPMAQKPVSRNRLIKAVMLPWLVAVVLLAVTALPCPAQDTTDKESKDGYVSIDFENVDINVFIKFISKLTGKNFVVDNRIKGNVTVVSPTRIPVKDAYKVFESVLEIHGFTTVPSGSVIKIVPQPNALADNIDTRLASEREEAADRIATRIIPLEYADSNELKKLFVPLLPKGSVILSYRDTNMLIVTASLSSIDRLLKIIKTIDVPNIGKIISVIPVTYADASKLVQTLSSIFTARVKQEKGKPDTDLMVQFVADERTNAIIILASNIETRRVKELVSLLDQQVPKGEEKIRVYYLEHASAEELAKVLQDIPTQKEEKPPKGKKQAPLLSRTVHISADKPTNSLIIMAEKEDYPVLEEVIAKLDIPRSMVYIECLIMEVNLTRGLEIGTEWKAGQSFENGDSGVVGGFGGSSKYSNLSDLSKGTLPSGFSLGVLGENISIGGVSFPDIQAVIQAYQSDEDVNILSTPQLLTTENEEAVITVGKNVPYQTRSAAESGSETYSSYEYKDVGISLKITPHISQGRLVRLDVFQELTKLDTASTQTTTDRPTTYKRQIETSIIVEDGNSVVIGGLIDEQTNKTHYKTPCLGDVPGLGWAFKTRSEGQEKTNLYVFLTPRVVRNPLEAEKIYKEKKQEIHKDMKKGEVSLYDRLDKIEKTISGKE